MTTCEELAQILKPYFIQYGWCDAYTTNTEFEDIYFYKRLSRCTIWADINVDGIEFSIGGIHAITKISYNDPLFLNKVIEYLEKC